MSDNIAERVYTLETRMPNEDAWYFKQFSPEYAKLCRRVWQDLKHGVKCDSKYVTKLCNNFDFMKRTVNSAVKQVRGRMNALKELQKVQMTDKRSKIKSLKNGMINLKSDINKLKLEVIKHPNDKILVAKYKNKKKKLYSWQVRVNKYENQIRNYEDKNIDSLDLCFGSKRFFSKQYNLAENNYKTHEKWLNDFRKLRDRQVYYIGSSDETCGNQMCQLYYYSEVDRFMLKIRKENAYCASSKKRDKSNYIWLEIDFKYKRDLLIFALQHNLALTYTITNKGRGWYIDVAFMIPHIIDTDTSNGCVGLDFNNGFIALTETDSKGNIVNVRTVKLHYHGTGNKAKSEMQNIISSIVKYTASKKKALCIEDLKFSKAKAQQIRRGKRRYNEMLHMLDYSRYKKCCSDYCITAGILMRLVNPAYTSKIGKQKYAFSKKLNTHNAAAYVIARRGQGFSDELVA